MAASSKTDAKSQASSELTTNFDDGNFVFHSKLPNGLAIRSVGIVNDVPEIRFDAAQNVPTIQEEDIATIVRLVSEKKRPEFYYISFPPTHPMHQCRYFNQYRPAWLRETGVGKLLADADWKMKCLSIGVRTNENKSVFKSWSSESQLENLATKIDFPIDKSIGQIIMSCEYVKVQKGNSEILFPEEPKMKITADSSIAYSEYVTDIYPSIAHYDEPNFLKMQELIKLIVAVEWLYNEKGVRVSKEWILKHTSVKTKEKAHPNCDSNDSSPPDRMIPKPVPLFKRPSNNITNMIVELCKKQPKYPKERKYGCYDFAGSQVIKFEEDGTKCPPQKCLKFCTEQHLSIYQQPVADIKQWFYSPILELNDPSADDGIRELLPQNSDQETEVIPPIPLKIDTKTDKSGIEVKITGSIQPCTPLSMTGVVTASVDNSNKHFINEDPNMPILPEIVGQCEAVIPNIKSWDELVSESVPIPRMWLDRISTPVAEGGVTTSNFSVREERLKKKVINADRRVWNGNYSRSGPLLSVRLESVRAQGTIRLVSRGSPEFAAVSEKFAENWIKGSCPPVHSLFAITNTLLEQKWRDYRQTLSLQEYEEHYHGTTLSCNITSSQTLCIHGACGICGISCSGLDPQCIRKNIEFQRFGSGFYLAPNSSKCHTYTQGAHGYRAMLQCDVLPGRRYKLVNTNNQTLNGPPHGFDSVFGQVGSKLNYPEIVVYNPHAVMPRYIIVYKKDGTDHLIP